MFKYLKAAWLLLLLTFSSRHRREWQRSMQAIDDLKILGGKLGYLIFEEDGRFVASRVDVDLVSDGATADEALAHLHEAEALYAEEVSSFKEDGHMTNILYKIAHKLHVQGKILMLFFCLWELFIQF